MKSKLSTALFLALLGQFALSPALEASTITVNTEADIIDTPECTLREAIASVNSGGALGGCQAVGEGVPDTVAASKSSAISPNSSLSSRRAASDRRSRSS